ncbi:MAG TPA: MBL fold metallo-hydrolase [bacterium]|nr:MBL fold metallo-hydrolase [bacterium]
MPTALAKLLASRHAAAQPNPWYDPAKPHTTPRGFRNVHPHEQHTARGLLRWRWERLWQQLPADPPPGRPVARVEPEAAFLRANRSEPTLTWIGHDTLLLQVCGVNVLTDPQFSERASPLAFLGPRRKVPPALVPAELPHIEVVLISHNHYDHLDRDSVRALQAQQGGPPRFVVPLGMRDWLAGEGIPGAVEQDWWEHTDYLGLRIHEVPAQHFSQRTPWDRNRVLWGGFVVEHPRLRFYFAGDTGYAPHFGEIGERLGPIDLAALPIGAYEPRWFMRTMHINPAEAVRAHQDLRARQSVAMHWGTFELTDEPMDEPPRALAEALAADGVPPERFRVMGIGETLRLGPLLRRAPKDAPR